jgi:hypothetical protein
MGQRDHHPDLSILDLFRNVAELSGGERITIGDFLHGLEDRATAALILLFALPNVLPTPPGTSTVLGFPLLILCAQFALGLPPWLPRFITRRSVNRIDFQKMLTRAEPWHNRAERFLKPRVALLSSYVVERIVGVLGLVLSIVLVLPIPLGNMAPATALCLISLGLLAADGIFILVGIAAGMVSLLIAGSVVVGLATGVWLGIRQMIA